MSAPTPMIMNQSKKQYQKVLGFKSKNPVHSIVPVEPSVPEEVMPGKHLLAFWWECLRKQPHLSPESARETTEGDGYSETSVYHCAHADHYHVGRGEAKESPSTGSSVSNPASIRKQWRKRNDKPSYEQLLAAYSDPSRELHRYWKDREFLKGL